MQAKSRAFSVMVVLTGFCFVAVHCGLDPPIVPNRRIEMHQSQPTFVI